jgi:hypothetical protein
VERKKISVKDQIKKQAAKNVEANVSKVGRIAGVLGGLFLLHETAGLTDPIVREVTYTNFQAGDAHYTIGVVAANFVVPPMVTGLTNGYRAIGNIFRSENEKKPMEKLTNPFEKGVSYLNTAFSLGIGAFVLAPFVQPTIEKWIHEPSYLTGAVMTNTDAAVAYMAIGLVVSYVVKRAIEEVENYKEYRANLRR